MEIDPAFANVHAHIGLAYLYSGKYDQRLDEWQKFVHLNNDPPADKAALDAVMEEFRHSGGVAAVRRMAKAEEEQSRTAYIDPALIATNYAIAGDKDKAFAWLEKAAAEHSAFFQYIKADPSYDPIRSDPRFAALLKRMGLPE